MFVVGYIKLRNNGVNTECGNCKCELFKSGGKVAMRCKRKNVFRQCAGDCVIWGSDRPAGVDDEPRVPDWITSNAK